MAPDGLITPYGHSAAGCRGARTLLPTLSARPSAAAAAAAAAHSSNNYNNRPMSRLSKSTSASQAAILSALQQDTPGLPTHHLLLSSLPPDFALLTSQATIPSASLGSTACTSDAGFTTLPSHSTAASLSNLGSSMAAQPAATHGPSLLLQQRRSGEARTAAAAPPLPGMAGTTWPSAPTLPKEAFAPGAQAALAAQLQSLERQMEAQLRLEQQQQQQQQQQQRADAPAAKPAAAHRQQMHVALQHVSHQQHAMQRQHAMVQKLQARAAAEPAVAPQVHQRVRSSQSQAAAAVEQQQDAMHLHALATLGQLLGLPALAAGGGDGGGLPPPLPSAAAAAAPPSAAAIGAPRSGGAAQEVALANGWDVVRHGLTLALPPGSAEDAGAQPQSGPPSGGASATLRFKSLPSGAR